MWTKYLSSFKSNSIKPTTSRGKDYPQLSTHSYQAKKTACTVNRIIDFGARRLSKQISIILKLI